MYRNHGKHNPEKYYNKCEFTESFTKIPAFVIVCNADGPIKEDEHATL